MNTVIKFRAWHKKYKKMYQVLHLHLDPIQGNWATVQGFSVIEDKEIHIDIQPKDCILIEFAGLLDKNEKEAYFGDLCHLCEGYGENGGLYKLEKDEYGQPHFVSATQPPQIFRIQVREYCIRHGNSNFEIIGNIHTTPELLNHTDTQA